MNKLTKIGVSALCGSLAAVSAANAGSMTATGGATVTWTQNEGTVTGNPLGMASGMTFTGSGELDNGNAVGTTIAMDDGQGFSTAGVTLDVAGLGKISFDQGGGTGLDRLDDETPSAWNVTNSAGLTTGIVIGTGAGNSTDIELAVSADMLPDGMTAYVSYNPRVGAGNVADKVASGDTGKGSGYDIVLRHTGLQDGLDVFAGYSVIEQNANTAGNISHQGDNTAYILGAKYAMGNFTVGYQYLRDNKQEAGVTAVRYYENDAFGISFAVNDDLTLSYGETRSTRASQGTLNNEAKVQSLQLSYTMGGATIAIAENSVDNASYVSGSANDTDGTTIALSLAF